MSIQIISDTAGVEITFADGGKLYVPDGWDVKISPPGESNSSANAGNKGAPSPRPEAGK